MMYDGWAIPRVYGEPLVKGVGTEHALALRMGCAAMFLSCVVDQTNFSLANEFTAGLLATQFGCY